MANQGENRAQLEENNKEENLDKLPRILIGALVSLVISYIVFHILYFVGNSFKDGTSLTLLFLMVPITALISLVICFFYAKKVLSFILFFLLNQILLWTLIQFIMNNYY